jgi:transposase InsO family protein
MYRVLRSCSEVRERRAIATHPPRTIPELVAAEPNRVWSYDSTHLRGPARGIWFYLFAMLDIYSRYSPGHVVLPAEEGEAVRDWIEATVGAAGPFPPASLDIHADNGGPMKSQPVSVLLANLHIGRTHSRPHVSNDNPYSEAGFKTLKYCPSFPARFASIEDARAFCVDFFDFYNHEHRHSGIGYHTPASVHFGTAAEVQAGRELVLASAYAAHPDRFVKGIPTPPRLPGPAWINKPKEETAQIIR